MRLIPILTTILAIALVSCQPAPPAPEAAVPDSLPAAPTPHPQLDSLGMHLVSASWLGPFEEQIVFLEDGQYQWTLDSLGIACEQGHFQTHPGGEVSLSHEQNCDHAEGRSNVVLGSARCRCEASSTSAEWREVLRCGHEGRESVFGNASAPTQPGDEVTLQGVRCTVLQQPGTATTSVRARSAPSPDSATVQMEDMATGAVTEELPQGAKVRLLARTNDQFMVGSWRYPWYYVRINAWVGNAWVFGRYIREDAPAGK